MSLPDQPGTFRPPTPAERPWSWQYEDSAGEVVTVEGDLGEQRFASQADAESWIGETWPQLVEAGVDAVTLLEVDRPVYGPMSLHP